MQITVINHLTLDGVMQAPGDANEDTRGGFAHGGWAAPRNAPEMFAAIGERMAKPNCGLLLGHFSYDGMLSAWNARGGPFKEALNQMHKYVASASATTKLPWPNSTLLHGDVPAAVADLRKQEGQLVIMGSGQLIRSLMPHGLIDEYLLMIHPIVMGTGRKLFDQGVAATDLKLVSSVATATGVIIGTFEPAA
jgi:dihydrofolate reductase